MKVLIFILILAGAIFWGYSFINEREIEPAAEGERSGSSGILADYVGANIQARDSAERTTGLAGLNQTIRQFESMEGRFPDDLEELVTRNYMPELPSPPRNQKFEYDAETGEVTTVPE